MKELNYFLETSTIHGLYHISTTRKYVKLFWIWVVLGGFSGAFVLIYQSFKGWEDSPYTTTIKTLPITDITFPKVIVCPPKNTFTNLNFDLMMADNLTVDDEQRNMLVEHMLDLLHESYYQELMANVSFLQDEDRYYNWYHGYTMFDIPSESYNQLHYPVYTTATYGLVSTKYFGYHFDADKVKNTFIKIDMKVPEIAGDNENVTIHVDIEWNPLKKTLNGYERFEFDGYVFGLDEKSFSINITRPRKLRNYYLLLDRKVSIEDVNKMQLDMMPGFKIKWFYEPEVPSKIEYNDHIASQEFIRLDDSIRL